MPQPTVQTLPVGHPARRAAASTIALSGVTALLFTGFAYVSTQLPAVRAGSPWQDDPYNGTVSFTLFLVPALTALIAVRAMLWRRTVPLPQFRVDQLLRAALASVLLVAATALTDWIAVALGADRPLWNGGTPLLIATLGALTALSIGAGLRCRYAIRQLPWRPARPPAGDWLDDLAMLIDAAAAHVAPAGRHPVDLRAAIDFLRRHIIAIAALASVLAALAVIGAQAISEGWTSPPLFGICVLIGAGGFFAFSLICNATLHIAVPRNPKTASATRRATWTAVVVGCLALPAAAVLRATIWTVLGHREEIDRISGLATVTVGGGLSAGLVALAVALALPFVLARHRPVRPGA